MSRGSTARISKNGRYGLNGGLKSKDSIVIEDELVIRLKKYIQEKGEGLKNHLDCQGVTNVLVNRIRAFDEALASRLDIRYHFGSVRDSEKHVDISPHYWLSASGDLLGGSGRVIIDYRLSMWIQHKAVPSGLFFEDGAGGIFGVFYYDLMPSMGIDEAPRLPDFVVDCLEEPVDWMMVNVPTD